MGDLNAKVRFFHETSNSNGDILEETLVEHDFLLVNNSAVTHKSFSGLSESVLDLVLCSNNMYKYYDQFKVLNEWQMGSDHIPIELSLKSSPQDPLTKSSNVNGEKNIRFNFRKADWANYQSILSHYSTSTFTKNLIDVENLNNFITETMLYQLS